ncbi:GerAB/ArcD/ProY family transporter [Paenibacillus sp. NPDC057967]|uniref:GerAB/ArcD/ProY family transporter n=1 Tax=Paenibacillus sp. NPDC057967 TaxID=3346293 RepID=UPI0036D9C8AA
MAKTGQVIAVFLLSQFGIIFFFYPSQIIESAESSHWLPVAMSFFFYLIMVGIYLKGIGYFGGQKSILSILQEKGRVVAIVMLLPVAVYFTVVSIITLRAYSEVIMSLFLTSTPIWAIMALLLGIAVYIAYLGLEAIFRTALLVVLLAAPIVLFVLLSSFQNADWNYLFPLLDKEALSFSFMSHPAFYKSLLAFSGGFLFLGFIQPAVAFKPSRVLIACICMLPVLLVSVYIPILTYGRSTAVLFNLPFLETAETVEITWLMFDRVSMFFMVCLISFIMLLLALIIWMTVRVLQLTVRTPDWVPLLLLAVMIYIICLLIPDWLVLDRLLWWNAIPRIYAIIILPIVLFVMGYRHAKNQKARESG